MLSPFFRFAAEEGCVQGKECQLLRKAFISKITKKKKRKRKKKESKTTNQKLNSNVSQSKKKIIGSLSKSYR